MNIIIIKLPFFHLLNNNQQREYFLQARISDFLVILDMKSPICISFFLFFLFNKVVLPLIFRSSLSFHVVVDLITTFGLSSTC